jgi:hypothetical protein
VTITLWMMPTCLALSSVQQKSHDFRPRENHAQSSLEVIGIEVQIRVGEGRPRDRHAAYEQVPDNGFVNVKPWCASCRSNHSTNGFICRSSGVVACHLR